MTNTLNSLRREIALATATIVLTAAASSAQVIPKDTERQLLAARDTVWRAWFDNDTVALNRLLPRASAAAENHGRDPIQWNDRSSILNGSRQFAASGTRLEQVEFAGTRIALDGSVAVITSNYTTVTRSSRGLDTARGRATEVFVRDGDRWVNPFWRLEPLGGSGLRDIPLPDTLGANFSIADSATKAGTPEDYDALLGFWEFRFQNRNQDGTFGRAFRGHWAFEKKPGGLLIEDHWRADNPTQPMGVSTYTYRTFDPQRKRWQMLGTNSQGGEFALGLTWSEGEERFAIQRYGSAIMRIRYLAIEPNHFLWRADRSSDGGRTWIRDTWMMEATRIAR